MSLFRRRRAAQQPADEPEYDEVDIEVDDEDETDEAPEEKAAGGPYDVSDAPDDDLDRLDLGALKIPALPGVEVQVQANEQGEVASVALIERGNVIQLGVFAAPRTEGIWDEVREELVKGLRGEGASGVAETTGEFGSQVVARVRTPKGPQDVRFVGIDGPRWFVRALYQGAVAKDPDVAPELTRSLRNVIVDRGSEAMPVREALPLKLPDEAIEQQQLAAEAEADDDKADGRTAPGR